MLGSSVCQNYKDTGDSFVRDPHGSGDGLCVAELLAVTTLGKPCLIVPMTLNSGHNSEAPLTLKQLNKAFDVPQPNHKGTENPQHRRRDVGGNRHFVEASLCVLLHMSRTFCSRRCSQEKKGR